MRNAFLFFMMAAACVHADQAALLADKAQVDNAVLTSNSQQYINGIYKLNIDGADTAMISAIVRGYASPPVALLNTNGMIGAPHLPVTGKYMLLVSPTRYAAPLPPGEHILRKDVTLFGTIQSAIDYAVNNPITPTIFSLWTILVDPGTYLENLLIQRTPYNPTQTASITLAALGPVTLGDGFTTGDVSWYVDNNPPMSSARYPGLMITVYRTDDTNYNARWTITKNFRMSRAAGYARNTMLQFHYVTLMGSLISDAVIATFSECIFYKDVNIQPANTGSYIMGSQGTIYFDTVSSYYISKMINCKFLNGITCNQTYISGSEGLFGFYRCVLQGTFTMSGVNPFYIDHFTDDASPSATYSNKTIMKRAIP